jgi:hypothetical protein
MNELDLKMIEDLFQVEEKANAPDLGIFLLINLLKRTFKSTCSWCLNVFLNKTEKFQCCTVVVCKPCQKDKCMSAEYYLNWTHFFVCFFISSRCEEECTKEFAG